MQPPDTPTSVHPLHFAQLHRAYERCPSPPDHICHNFTISSVQRYYEKIFPVGELKTDFQLIVRSLLAATNYLDWNLSNYIICLCTIIHNYSLYVRLMKIPTKANRRIIRIIMRRYALLVMQLCYSRMNYFLIKNLLRPTTDEWPCILYISSCIFPSRLPGEDQWPLPVSVKCIISEEQKSACAINHCIERTREREIAVNQTNEYSRPIDVRRW